MKKVIQGVLCDTATAKYIGSASYLGDRDFAHWNEELYRTKSGKYFLYGEGGPASRYAVTIGQNEWSGGEKIQLLSRETAMKWAEEYLDGDEYIAAFGNPEEAEKAMSVILPLKTRERLEVLKAETGMTFSEIIARAVEGYQG